MSPGFHDPGILRSKDKEWIDVSEQPELILIYFLAFLPGVCHTPSCHSRWTNLLDWLVSPPHWQ